MFTLQITIKCVCGGGYSLDQYTPVYYVFILFFSSAKFPIGTRLLIHWVIVRKQCVAVDPWETEVHEQKVYIVDTYNVQSEVMRRVKYYNNNKMKKKVNYIRENGRNHIII